MAAVPHQKYTQGITTLCQTHCRITKVAKFLLILLFADFALACILTKIRVGFLVVISTYGNLFLSLSFLDIFVKVTFLSNDKILPEADVAFIAMPLGCHMLLQIKAS